MNLQKLNDILKNGEYLDTWRAAATTYYKILYNNIVYVISENKKGVKICE